MYGAALGKSMVSIHFNYVAIMKSIGKNDDVTRGEMVYVKRC